MSLLHSCLESRETRVSSRLDNVSNERVYNDNSFDRHTIYSHCLLLELPILEEVVKIQREVNHSGK